jgi:hypothetical protein
MRMNNKEKLTLILQHLGLAHYDGCHKDEFDDLLEECDILNEADQLSIKVQMELAELKLRQTANVKVETIVRPDPVSEWTNVGGKYPGNFSVCPCRVDVSLTGFKACGKRNNISENQIYCRGHTRSFMEKGWFKNGCCLVKGEGMFGTNEQIESFGTKNVKHKLMKSRGIGSGEFIDKRPPMIRDMYPVNQSGEYDWGTQMTSSGIEIPENPPTSSDED